MSIGSVATSARSGPEGDKIVGGAATSVSDIDIAGVLHIDSIRSSVSGAVNATPGGAAVAHSLDVEGATVAGQRVYITPDGVEAADQSVGPFPLEDSQTAINDALKSAGIVVRLVPPEKPVASEDGRNVSATSGGVGFFYRDATGTNVYYLFGQSMLKMFANRIDPGGGLGSFGDDVAGGAADGQGAGTATPARGVLSGGPVSAPEPPEPGAGLGRPSRTRRAPMITGMPVVERTWRIPYPPFALLVVSLPLLSVMRRLAPTRRRS